MKRIKTKVMAVLIPVLMLSAYGLNADSCYKDGTSIECTSPGTDPTSPGNEWKCDPAANEDGIKDYNPDPTNKGFYVLTRGCKKCMVCRQHDQRDKTVCGDEGQPKDQQFQDGSCGA